MDDGEAALAMATATLDERIGKRRGEEDDEAGQSLRARVVLGAAALRLVSRRDGERVKARRPCRALDRQRRRLRSREDA
jgi:hypothetical protein